MGQGRAEGNFGLARFVHGLWGVAVLLRVLAMDAGCALPRNPVSWLMAFAVPRRLSLLLPSLDGAINLVGDADLTPPMLALALLSLALLGGLRREVLWRSRRAKAMTLVLCAVSPAVWAHRHVHVVLHSAAVHEDVVRAFGSEVAPHAAAQASAYDWMGHILNAHGGKPNAESNLTLAYKHFELPSARNQTCHSAPYHENRQAMESGTLGLDVFQPTGGAAAAALHDSDPAQPKQKGAAVVIFVHGGAWKGGDRSALSFQYRGGIPGHLRQQGYLLVSVSYRLHCTGSTAEGSRGAAMREDILHAIAFVTEHAESWGGDPARLALWGNSAGGHLALLAAYTAHLPQVRGVVSFYGVTEVRAEQVRTGAESLFESIHAFFFIRATSKLCASDHGQVGRKEDEEGEGEGEGEGERGNGNDDCWARLSPRAHVTPRSPPTLLLHGREDAIVNVNQARWLRDELARNGVPHVLVEVPCAAHSCDVHCSSPCSQLGLFALERFLHNVTSLSDN